MQMYKFDNHHMLNEQEIFGFYNQMEKQDVMLSFRGALTSQLLDSILTIVEQKLDQFEETTKIKKKVFNVLVECMQNLYHHSDLRKSLNEQDCSVILMIAKKEDGYCIITGNHVLNENVSKLRSRIDEINEMSKEEMKAYYKSILNNGTFSDKGGGGLGIIDIARRSGQKLKYGFVPVDKENSFFSLNVSIN